MSVMLLLSILSYINHPASINIIVYLLLLNPTTTGLAQRGCESRGFQAIKTDQRGGACIPAPFPYDMAATRLASRRVVVCTFFFPDPRQATQGCERETLASPAFGFASVS